MTATEGQVSLRDPEVIRRPYDLYEHMREQAPVYYDPAGFYVLSRYEDIRTAVRDLTAFNSEHATEIMRGAIDEERAERVRNLFLEKGWPRAPAVGNYEGAEHDERRALFERFLRAGKVRDYDGMVRETAYRLVEKFADRGHCELVSEFSEQFSLQVICRLLGAPDEAIPLVKGAVDALLKGFSMSLTEEEEIAGVEQEIAAQHFFKGLIDKIRAEPDDTLLSAFINSTLPSGHVMTDPEILMHVMIDLFFAGAETTAKAITTGVAYLCAHPDVFAELQARPEEHLRTFAEEVLRLEPPFSGLFRVAVKDVTLHGVTIPKGSVVIFRVAAANLDRRQFACPAHLDLERQNAATHLTFGSGVHACVGAPLARRELHWAFKALLDNLTDLRLAEGETPTYAPNMMFRGIERLNVTFKRRQATA